MIILDTNVLSEMMRPEPAASVARWLSAHGRADLRTTAITQAEILAGIACLPIGRRRRSLEQASALLFTRDFADRIIAFGAEAPQHYAHILSIRRQTGRPVQPLDAMIAAIARANGAAIATRNVPDFEGCGIILHDPWAG